MHPLTFRAFELLQEGHRLIDAPAEHLDANAGLLSWHRESHGVGRLTDHLAFIKRHLAACNAKLRIATDSVAVTLPSGRVQYLKAAHLTVAVPIADARQRGLFD
jgi:hypothetical protein